MTLRVNALRRAGNQVVQTYIRVSFQWASFLFERGFSAQNRKKGHLCLTDEPINNLMFTEMKGPGFGSLRDSDDIINRACDFFGESKKRRKDTLIKTPYCILVLSFSKTVLSSCFGVSTAYTVKVYGSQRLKIILF